MSSFEGLAVELVGSLNSLYVGLSGGINIFQSMWRRS